MWILSQFSKPSLELSARLNLCKSCFLFHYPRCWGKHQPVMTPVRTFVEPHLRQFSSSASNSATNCASVFMIVQFRSLCCIASSSFQVQMYKSLLLTPFQLSYLPCNKRHCFDCVCFWQTHLTSWFITLLSYKYSYLDSLTVPFNQMTSWQTIFCSQRFSRWYLIPTKC